MTKSKSIIFIIVLFLGIVSLRLINLGADAPDTLSWGRGTFTDESFYAHNARNKVLFNQWQKDDFNYMLVSPLMNLINWAAFSLMGISYHSIRLASVIFSALTILAFYLWVRRNVKNDSAIIGLFLFGFNYFYLMHSRLALSEIPMLFFIVVSVLLMDIGTELGLFFSGVSFVVGCLTKSLALFFILPLGLAWWLSGDRKKIIFFILGGLSTVTLGYLWLVKPNLVKPNLDEFWKIFKIFVGQRAPRQLSQIIKVFHAEYFAQLPVITVLTLISLVNIFQRPNNLKKIEIISIFWFLGGLVFLSLWSYTTQAYFLILLTPMVVLASVFLEKLWKQKDSIIVKNQSKLLMFVLSAFAEDPVYKDGDEGEKDNPPFLLSQESRGDRLRRIPPKSMKIARLLSRGASFLLSYFIIRYGIIFYARDYFFANKFTKLLLEIIALLGTMGLIKFSYYLNEHLPKPDIKKNIFIIFVVIFVIFNLSFYLKWVLNPGYQIKNISRDLNEVCPYGTVGGSWAPALCLETNLVEFPFWENVVNDKNLTRAIPLTHLLLEESDFELGFIKRVYPEILKSAHLIRTYNLYKWKIGLWEID